MKQRGNFLKENYRLKTTVVGLASFVVGLSLLTLARHIGRDEGWSWLSFWPLGELGGVLVGAGLLGVVWDYFDGKDRETRDDARVRRLLKESAPDFTDAVLRGLAVSPDDLKRVASPELLDSIATNTIGIRLGDPQFASEIYTDIRDQAIRAPERWRDVQVSIRLSTAVERSTAGAPLFDVLIEWEYTTIPAHALRKFACVSDRDEYNELTSDVPATSTWFMTPRAGLDASSRESYELLYFSVDGKERPIRRSARKTGQTYSATVGDDLVGLGKPVRIRHVYRVRTAQAGHFLYIEVPQPTHGFSLDVDYSDADISKLRVTDLLSSAHGTQIARLPGAAGAKSVSVDHPSWIFPRAGVALAWTLLSEEAATTDAHAKPAA